MGIVTYKVFNLARNTVAGKTINPQAKIAKVDPKGLKAKLVQDPGYVQTLRESGLFSLPREAVSVADAFKLGGMPSKNAFGVMESDAIISTHADQVVLATSANEAPLHYGQLTYNEEVSDPLRSREALSGFPPENRGLYYCLVYSKTKGLAFKTLQLNIGQPRLSDPVVVSGKPLIWDGKATCLSDYLPSCISDVRHVFKSPEISGMPIISRRLAQIARNGETHKLEKLIANSEKLPLNLKETQEVLEELGLPSELKDIQEAFNAAFDNKWDQSGNIINFPLVFNLYRHTFWAMLNSGEILAGIISNKDPETRNLGVTIPELQQFLLGLNAKQALTFGAGKDNRLYFASQDAKTGSRRIVDLDYRAVTPSGILMIVSEEK